MAPKTRTRLLEALSGAAQDNILLTVPLSRLSRSETERRLRNEGVCLTGRGPPLLRPVYRSVDEERVFSGKAGAVLERIHVRTKHGELTSVVQHTREHNVTWTTERFFKSPYDYKPLTTLFRDQRFESNFAAFEAAQNEAGEDVLLCPNLGASPLHLIMHTLMGLETFAHEWADQREQILDLVKALAENQKRRLLQAAKSPALAITYGGVLNAREIGPARFTQYYLPPIRDFADLMHRNGKLAGIRVLGDPRPLAEAIGRSNVDFIKGFQDAGFRVEEARRAWPDTTLWAEVPPAAHLLPEDGMQRWAVDLSRRDHQGRVVLSVGAVPPGQQNNIVAVHRGLLEAQSSRVGLRDLEAVTP